MSRRFRPQRNWQFWLKWLFVLFIAVRIVAVLRNDDRPRDLSEGSYQVSFVIDGDTLVLDDGKRVRLIGVDTPEVADRQRRTTAEPWANEAATFSRNFVDDARGRLRLQFDDERVDRYGRYLAYVWHGDHMLNEELLRAGMARFTPGYRYSETMKRRFRQAERQARDAQQGIWSQPAAATR